MYWGGGIVMSRTNYSDGYFGEELGGKIMRTFLSLLSPNLSFILPFSFLFGFSR